LQALIDRGTAVVGIAGNHDFLWEKTDAAYYLPWSYLQDEAVEVNDLKIHGTPWCPVLRAWAFYGNDVLLEEKAALIPKCDILIAHSPPYGYGDRVLSGEHVGNCAIPTDAAPVVITGHIHEAYGLHRAPFMDVYNVSHMDVHYNPINPPVEICP
jgi:Icc-related predicted phosphoesterase